MNLQIDICDTNKDIKVSNIYILSLMELEKQHFNGRKSVKEWLS